MGSNWAAWPVGGGCRLRDSFNATPESVSASGGGAVGTLAVEPTSGLPAGDAPRSGAPHCGTGALLAGSGKALAGPRSGDVVGATVGVEPIGGRPHCAQA